MDFDDRVQVQAARLSSRRIDEGCLHEAGRARIAERQIGEKELLVQNSPCANRPDSTPRAASGRKRIFAPASSLSVAPMSTTNRPKILQEPLRFDRIWGSEEEQRDDSRGDPDRVDRRTRLSKPLSAGA
ncbi:MAG: hypothetical protein JNL28_02855 [Planctomycetes bacterium]|nr:hypothetical protein [Planctomycetota bacterium]